MSFHMQYTNEISLIWQHHFYYDARGQRVFNIQIQQFCFSQTQRKCFSFKKKNKSGKIKSVSESRKLLVLSKVKTPKMEFNPSE